MVLVVFQASIDWNMVLGLWTLGLRGVRKT